MSDSRDDRSQSAILSSGGPQLGAVLARLLEFEDNGVEEIEIDAPIQTEQLGLWANAQSQHTHTHTHTHTCMYTSRNTKQEQSKLQLSNIERISATKK